MSQPPSFNRAFSFSNFQASNPLLSIPGGQVDLELNNAQASLDGATLAKVESHRRWQIRERVSFEIVNDDRRGKPRADKVRVI